jgi:hypothetical protein
MLISLNKHAEQTGQVLRANINVNLATFYHCRVQKTVHVAQTIFMKVPGTGTRFIRVLEPVLWIRILWFWASRIRILPSTSKKSKKNLDFFFEKIYFFVGIFSATDKKAESGPGAGSVSQWYGSADP